jgi:hypothetical protein
VGAITPPGEPACAGPSHNDRPDERDHRLVDGHWTEIPAEQFTADYIERETPKLGSLSGGCHLRHRRLDPDRQCPRTMRGVRAFAVIAGVRVIVVVDMNDLAVLQRPSLRARRLAARVTLQALAERAGVSYSMVQLLDRGYQPGRSDVRAKVLVALAELEDDRPLEAA